MHTLLIHQNYVDHSHPGGTRHLDFASHFAENGHRTTIVASTVDYLSGNRIENCQPVRHAGRGGGEVVILRAFAIPSVQRSLLWRAVSFLSFVPFAFWKALRSGPIDVVLATTPPLFQLPAPWMVAKLRRVPLVLEVLDLWPEFAVGMGVLRSRTLLWLAQRVEIFFYRAADQIVVNSPAYKDYIAAKGIDPARITVIPMGVDLTLFDPDRQSPELRQAWGVQEKFVVTYAGAMGAANDLSTILRAAERLRDNREIQFVLVGDGNQRKMLEAEAAQRKLPNVTFAGTYPKSQMIDVLAASDACIATLKDIPQFRMPYPNKVFDYMAAGKPIILGIAGVIEEVVRAAQAGICIAPGNDEQLAEAALELQRAPAKVRQMSRAGRDYVQSHFDARMQADRFQQVLQQAVLSA